MLWGAWPVREMKAEGLVGWKAGVLVSLWVKFGRILWIEEEGILGKRG